MWSMRVCAQRARTRVNCVELHHVDLREVCLPRSAHLPGLTSSQRVRGPNPLSATLAVTLAGSESSQFSGLM